MNLNEEIKNSEIPVIIFGAGLVGEVLFKYCYKEGIKVDCFCDNNIHKTKEKFCDMEVVYAQKLKEKYNDAIFLISAADIKDVIAQLRTLGYFKWHPGNLLLKDFDIYQCEYGAPIDFVEYAVARIII